MPRKTDALVSRVDPIGGFNEAAARCRGKRHHEIAQEHARQPLQ